MGALDSFNVTLGEEDLERLEQALRLAVTGEDPYLNEVATHLIDAGGKRLRPCLTLAAASLDGAPLSERTVLGAVSVELVHLASLYHDDVMDEAQHRRNVESVNARHGNLIAIVAGDFLLARSAEIAASLGTEIAQLLAATLARLCRGQIAEVHSAYDVRRDEADYLLGIGNKTAALMSTACRIGGLTAHLSRSEIEALTEYGEALGMVFQLRDDILDVVGNDAELGKEPGQDLAEGIYTLPVQRAFEDIEVRDELHQLLGRRLAAGERDRARELVAASCGIPAAVAMAGRYARSASRALAGLGDDPVVKALSSFADDLADDCARPRPPLLDS